MLPSGVNKASGLAAALRHMGLWPHNAVGVGDADNDHAFLALCECAVAVANAPPALKDRADLVMARDHGAGLSELIGQLLADDLASQVPRLRCRADARRQPAAVHLVDLAQTNSTRALRPDGIATSPIREAVPSAAGRLNHNGSALAAEQTLVSSPVGNSKFPVLTAVGACRPALAHLPRSCRD